MVLRDDRFPTILEAMREGRVIFGNIRNFAVYLMSCNVSQLLVVGLAVGAGLPTPLLPLQILFLNVVTGVFPAARPWPRPRQRRRIWRTPPRDPDEPIVNRARLGGHRHAGRVPDGGDPRRLRPRAFLAGAGDRGEPSPWPS